MALGELISPETGDIKGSVAKLMVNLHEQEKKLFHYVFILLVSFI